MKDLCRNNIGKSESPTAAEAVIIMSLFHQIMYNCYVEAMEMELRNSNDFGNPLHNP